jgi:pimeloyl-ACP methyl ester carboxylesterase
MVDAPIAAVDHPTSGVGPSCGPTHATVVSDNVAIPLVGLGYAVVAPDYAGMGVDNGMTSYLIGASEAAATLDGLRALQQFHDTRFDNSQLGTDLFVLGHSQGGHAALFTHGAFAAASLGLDLLGSVSFAPGWGDIRQVAAGFTSASHADDANATFVSMALYTHMLYTGGPAASTWLTTGAATSFPGWLHELCGPALTTAIESNFATEGALYQPAFLQAAASCPLTAPCSGFMPWSQELIAEQPGAFSSAAPALLMQGGQDTLVTAEQTACIVQRLAAAGTPVEACDFPNDSHTTIVASALPAAAQWMNGRRGGIVPSVCPSPLTATCNP